MTVRQAGRACAAGAFTDSGAEDAEPPAESFRHESALLAAAAAV
ncbi:hypothetical protein [Streptomyces sp. NPDC001714]